MLVLGVLLVCFAGFTGLGFGAGFGGGAVAASGCAGSTGAGVAASGGSSPLAGSTGISGCGAGVVVAVSGGGSGASPHPARSNNHKANTAQPRIADEENFGLRFNNRILTPVLEIDTDSVASAGGAARLSGPFWGRFSDRSSRRVLIWTSALIALLGALVSALDWGLRAVPDTLMAAAIFLLVLLHQGVRLGRKTFLLDLASGNRRTDYVAVGNSLTGVLLLVIGGLGAALASWSIPLAIAVFSLMALTACALAVRFPEVED